MAGIYIHIPFCKQACSYCDFHFSTTFSPYRESLIEAMCQELEKEQDYLKGQSIETIYFGGGTPSLLKEEELTLILDTVYTLFSTADLKEFTFEVNPDDVSIQLLDVLKSAGVSRLSLGVQSFRSEDLEWMNRAHTAKESTAAIELAQQYGFDLTVDLMYGLPNSSAEDWRANIEQLLELGPQHISAYCLTIEDKTALANWIKKGRVSATSEEAQSLQFEMLLNELSSSGYEQYEISNFATKDNYSIHNSNYWRGRHYLGIGPSAHSFNGISRRWNVANNRRYIKNISSGECAYTSESLTPKDQFNELIMTGLRTKWGVSLGVLKEHCEIPTSFYRELESFEDYDLVARNGNVIYLTDAGKLQADHISSVLFLSE